MLFPYRRTASDYPALSCAHSPLTERATLSASLDSWRRTHPFASAQVHVTKTKKLWSADIR